MSLTADELGLLQDEAVVWMPDRCDTFRYTSSDDAFGGRGDETEEPVLTDVPCSVETGAGHEQILASLGIERQTSVYLVALPADTDVRVRDHIVVTTKGNLHLMVQAVMAPETEEIERRVVANSAAEHNV